MSENIVETPADIFCRMQTSPNTQRAYRNDIKHWQQFLASRNGEENSETAIAFKEALVKTYAASTAQRIWCTVAAFYGWMKGTGRVESTPFHGIKSPTRSINESPPVPSDQEVADLLHACDDGTTYGNRGRAIIALLLNGLRAQEVCDAKTEDIKRDELNKQWILNVHGKGDKWRAVPLTSITQDALFDYFLNKKTPTEYLITGVKSGEQMNVKAVWRAVSFFSLKAGVTGMHPHALRHHYATRLVRAKVDLFTLQKLMGHERADTTQRYVNLDYSDLAKAVELDPLHDKGMTHNTLFFGLMKEAENQEPLPF